MTDRASFLAAIRSTPRGLDPGLPDRREAPDAPTQLRAGEERPDRLQAEAEAASTIVHRVTAVDVGATVASVLVQADAQRIALTTDLAPFADDVQAALVAAGLTVTEYVEVAPDRARAGALDATVTGCIAAVAATGSVVTSAAGAGRAGALIAPTHICVVRDEQIVGGLHELFDGDALAEAGSLFALQSGPSRSADIEKVLILGVHGPGNVHLIIVAPD
ncbi:MAG: LUD domain-containing protein [Thermoleophilia bacterium]|nr:LUD domain-containing protein [Thermoleophilia bacterium]